MSNENNAVKLNEQQEIAMLKPHTERTVVTAAAGSGKTMLLVERIVRLLSDRKLGVKADSVAVMTFTRNATKSLREKLNKTLKKRLEQCSKNSEDYSYISEQILLLRQAYISTIDSFCLRLIRENPEAFDLPLNFSMATMMKKITMRLRAVDLAMRDFYNEDTQNSILPDDNDNSNNSPQRVFFSPEERRALFYTFNFENDDELQKNLMSVEDKLSTFVNAEEWLDNTVKAYSSRQNYENCYLKTVMLRLESYYNKAIKLLEEYDDILAKIEKQAKDKFKDNAETRLKDFKAGTLNPMKEYIQRDRERFEGFMRGFETLRNDPAVDEANILVENFKKYANIGKAASIRGCPNGVEARTRFTATKDKFIKLAGQIAKLDLSNDIDPERFSELQTAVNAFIKLLRLYHDRYMNIKISSGNLDFSDCELLLLKKLSDDNFRESVASRFKCVIVDEFQDSNDIQAEIFKKIGGENLFYVGDVKQSIYAFRGGNPMIMASLCDGADNFTAVPLNKNYRSREAVINTVNAAFSKLMTREYGGVEYADPDNRLECGAILPEIEDKKKYYSEIIFVNTGKTAEKEMIQPRAVAQKIKQLHDDESFLISKNGKLVRPQYSDFSILMRTTSKMPYYRLALAELGVATAAPGGRKFLETDEISLILDYLTIVDNPQRNEETLKVLMSPIYRLNAEEMSLIRLGLLGIDIGKLSDDEKREIKENAENHSLYSCARICSNTEYTLPKTGKKIPRKVNSKLQAFFEDITRFRYFMCTNSVYRLVCKICEDTDLLSTVAAFSDSEQRIANVRQFQDMAAEYESRDGGSLSDFLRYIEYAKSLKDNNIEEAQRPETAEAVKIMTFHASKGLEFPVCIMCELENTSSDMDIKGSLILNRDKFLALKSVDSKRRVKTENLAFSAVKAAIKKGLIGEELRLLYVAMTRAQDKLIMFAKLSQDSRKKWMSTPFDPENLSVTFEQGAPFKWVFDSLMRYYDPSTEQFSPKIQCVISTITAPEKQKPQSTTKEYTNITDDEIRALANKISFKYKYESDTLRRAKFSVTEIAHMNSEGERVNCVKPDFIKNGELTGAEIGTAYHKCMEIIPLDELKAASESEYTKIVSRTISNTKELTEDEKRGVRSEKIVDFLISDLGRRMLKSSEIRREKRFYELIDGKEIGYDALGTFMLQGVVDMYFVEDGEIVVVDYKTDSVANFIKERENYEKQVKIYSTVLPLQTMLPVKEVYLYTFTDGEEYKIR